MKEYPILGSDGAGLVKEDLEAGWSLAGTVDDQVRASFAQVATEATNRSGYAVPEQDVGALVQGNGASGTVAVKPFTAFRSGLTTGTQRDLLSAYYAGGTATIPTPLPTATNHRWDLLYAIVAETDGTSESRFVEDATTEAVTPTTVNTRHAASVTLAWVQGTIQPTATTPYPAGSFPALPAPAAGQAHIPLAWVHVSYSATPATVTYNVDSIINDPNLGALNPMTGGQSVASAGLAEISTTAYAALNDVKALVTDATSSWTTGTGNRPPHFVEHVVGETKLYLFLDFRNTIAIGAAWAVINKAIVDPVDTASALYRKLGPYSLLDRIYEGRIWPANAEATTNWAWNQAASAANRVFPTRFTHVVAQPARVEGLGNTIYPNADFDTAAGFATGDWLLACYFPSVTAANSDIALLVRKAAGGGFQQGALYVAAREATNGDIEGRAMFAKVEMSTRLNAYGF